MDHKYARRDLESQLTERKLDGKASYSMQFNTVSIRSMKTRLAIDSGTMIHTLAIMALPQRHRRWIPWHRQHLLRFLDQQPAPFALQNMGGSHPMLPPPPMPPIPLVRVAPPVPVAPMAP